MTRNQRRSRSPGMTGHDAEIAGHVGPKYACELSGVGIEAMTIKFQFIH
jgi:hypothetical protein